MTDIEVEQPAEDSVLASEGDRHDPIMAMFIAWIMVLLAALAVLLLIAAGRPPAGL